MQASDVVRFLVSLQVIGATTVFFLLGAYNPKNTKRYHEAREALGKKDKGPFDLPANREGFAAKSCENPFENTTWLLTWYERVKLSIMAVTVFPMRLLGAVSAVASAWLMASVLLKMRLQSVAKLVVALAARVFLFCFGFYHIPITGRQADGVGAIVSNHSSFLDGFVWVAISTPRIFAEQSNFQGALMQVFMKALKVVCFDRSGRESRKMARETMAAAAAEACAGAAPPILVFPEGTTHNSKVIITFKDGAFTPGLPVQPALLRYKFEHCDPTWVFAGPGMPMLIFRLMCQVVNKLEVEFLPVCTPSEEERANSYKFAHSVQLKMAEALGVPVTENSVEDVQLQMAAVKAHLPPEVGVVGYSAIREAFSVDTKQVKEHMLVFKEMAGVGAAGVSCEEFVDCFRRAFHSPTEAQAKLLREFFLKLTDGQESLDFRKFLVGLALVDDRDSDGKDTPTPMSEATSPPRFETYIEKYRERMYAQLAFAAFASTSDDSVSWTEFKDLWLWLYPSQSSDGHDEEDSVRKQFEEIGGEGETLTFEKFSDHAERHPHFEKRLRQAFFSRISAQLSAL
jgi:lysophosphatidylcholine acyltransferase/lyso-PAF acetyltransferase